VRCRIIAPFCGKAVVSSRSCGPPGSASLTIVCALARTAARLSAVAPMCVRKKRRLLRAITSSLAIPHLALQSVASALMQGELASG
jgi:hypothetical protein